MAVRKNVTNLTADEKARYVSGVKEMKRRGRYDLFIQIHARVMSIVLTNNANAGHMGSAFLPWHREFILRFERELQQALSDSNFGLPYWDWAADANLTPSQMTVWQPDFLGGDGNPLPANHPFAAAQWSTVPPGGLVRAFGQDATVRTLPNQNDVTAALAITAYDSPPFNMDSGVAPGSGLSFRNTLEGFVGSGLHNRVHTWIGGQMAVVPRAPNDPVFFLHHANVDRIWAQWQLCSPTPTYLPQSGGPTGLNFNDPMWPWLPTTDPRFDATFNPNRDVRHPANVDDHVALGYTYDTETSQPQTITLRRTTGNRFVSSKTIQVVSPCNPQTETSSTVFVPGRVGGVIRAERGTQQGQIDVVP